MLLPFTIATVSSLIIGSADEDESRASMTPAQTLGPAMLQEPARSLAPVPIRPLEIDPSPSPDMSKVVRSIHQDKSGRLWVGGEDLYCHDGKKLTAYALKDDLGRGVTVKEMVEDAEGNIWIGTTGGISKISGELYSSYGEQHGLISRDVWSIGLDARGDLWIGTIEGLCRFDGETFTAFPLPEAEPDRSRGITSGRIVHCITMDSRDRMWFGTNGGAHVLDGDSLSNFCEADGLANDAVSHILEDRAGNIWFGTTHGGVSRFDGESFTNFTQQGAVEGTEVWSLYEDRAGAIWFGGKHFGANRFAGGTFTNFGKQHGLDTAGIMAIYEDEGDRAWFGGVGGLFRRDTDSFVRVSPLGPWQ